MDLVVRERANACNIPLRCVLCPKKPKFSDLSHLLTHVSSKSHLAHRFKAELKALGDPVIRSEVQQYDDWCDRYQINSLLVARMTSKQWKEDVKKLDREARASTTVVSCLICGNIGQNLTSCHRQTSVRLGLVVSTPLNRIPMSLASLCQLRRFNGLLPRAIFTAVFKARLTT